MELHMFSQPAAQIERPTLFSEHHWTMQRANGEWCSLDCSTAGWTLSMHGGEFTVLAEGGGGGDPDIHDIDALRSRLRAQGWNEMQPIGIRPKADRRRASLLSLPRGYPHDNAEQRAAAGEAVDERHARGNIHSRGGQA